MKQLTLFAASILLLQVPGAAAPCMTGTLASYIAMADAGCQLGNLQVSAFTYKANAHGGAADITADQITVTPILAPVGAVALQFAAPWSVQPAQKQLSDITYQAVLISPTPTQHIQTLSLNGNGLAASGISSVVVNDVVATQAVTTDLKVFMTCNEICHSQTSVSASVSAVALAVIDKVTLTATLGSASLASFEDWFITCAPCV